MNADTKTYSRMVFLAALGLVAARATAGDWPQFRHDSRRSAVSADQLPDKLHLQWTREFPQPRPAFPGEVRLRYDAVQEPVVLGKSVFVPSMITDSVTSLDTETGKIQWRFFAEGPVRFAPVASQGKVHFASDDGYLYCVAASDGSLLWKVRGLPEDRADRKVMGNKRLISLWPARGGPVLENGVVYFTAGLWPTYDVFAHAVDADTGRILWSNTDSNRVEGANMDHGQNVVAGVTPQGYLALVNGMLVVPCGAQLPAFLNPKTGKLGRYTMGWGGRNGLPKGSWFVAGAGKYLSHSGDLYDVSKPSKETFRQSSGRNDFKRMLYAGGFTRLLIDPTNHRELGEFRMPVLSKQTMYDSHDGVITAHDLQSAAIEDRNKSDEPNYRKTDRYPDRIKAIFRERWRFSSPLQPRIRAGNRLYLAGKGAVAAIDLPRDGDSPRTSWQAKIEGTPHRLLAADDKLFVMTREGR
ncbi:MAG: PQQ-binding-like beta-propeller repeat protein, partial [Planctomycetales bacterium]